MNSPGERPFLLQVLLIGLALVCGMGFWTVVQLTETEEVQLSIPIVAENLEPEVMLKLKPMTADVRFSYAAAESVKMIPSNFYVAVDFRDLKDRIGKRIEDAGERSLTKEMVRDNIGARSLNINAIEMLTPSIGWEGKLRTARGVIKPVIVGEPLAGFTYDEARATVDGPSEITVVITPEKERELVSAAQDFIIIPTKPLDVAGLSGLVREQRELDLPPGVSLLGDDENRVQTIILEITEETRTNVLKGVKVSYQFISAGDGLIAEVNPPTVDVLVKGRRTAVDKVKANSIVFLMFGVSEKVGDSTEVALEARISDPTLRAEIEQIEPQPKVVLVTIKSKSTPSATVTPTHTPSVTPSPSPTATPAASPTPPVEVTPAVVPPPPAESTLQP